MPCTGRSTSGASLAGFAPVKAVVRFPIMVSRKNSQNVTVQLVGQSVKAEIGRVAAKAVSRTGEKTRGKYDHEALRGHEFNVEGNLMQKERIIDRKNNSYKELVVNIDTGEVVRDVEHPLSEHIGYGSAKHEKKTT